MKVGILKGYRNGVAYLLLEKPITELMTLEKFHVLRCNTVNYYLKEFERFETELKGV